MLVCVPAMKLRGEGGIEKVGYGTGGLKTEETRRLALSVERCVEDAAMHLGMWEAWNEREVFTREDNS